MSIYRTNDIRSVARVLNLRPEDVLLIIRDHNSMGDLTMVPEGSSQRMAMADRIFVESGSYANSILTDKGIDFIRDQFEALFKLGFDKAWDEAHALVASWSEANAEIASRA